MGLITPLSSHAVQTQALIRVLREGVNEPRSVLAEEEIYQTLALP